MTNMAIRIEGLGKRYRYGGVASLSYNLRADLTEWFQSLVVWRRRANPRQDMRSGVHRRGGSPSGSQSSLRQTRRQLHEQHLDDSPDYFWAIKDINLEVRRGEVVGVIGRNGAGKSTLLKVLSRITPPTSGRIEYSGRLASLLEVGTGFHRELTGRENIFLNGSILGMKRSEIVQKFDEIVAFAEVEKFIDTPVKFYSSGMYVRLAFAVAAHLDTDILLVDEVLAVGDSAFQRRCLGKMEEVASSGRTVLFVSHNMAAVSTLCQRCILLDNGAVSAQGPSSDMVVLYHSQIARSAAAPSHDSGRGHCRLISAAVVDGHGEATQSVGLGEPVDVVMVYDVLKVSDETHVPNLHFVLPNGSYAFTSNAPGLRPCKPGRYRATCHVPANLLNEGSLSIGCAVTAYRNGAFEIEFYEPNLLYVNVTDPKTPNEYNYGYTAPIPGAVRPMLDWSVEGVDR